MAVPPNRRILVLPGELPASGGMISVSFAGDPYVTLMWIQKPSDTRDIETSSIVKRKHKTAKKWLKAKQKNNRRAPDGTAAAPGEACASAACEHVRFHELPGPRDNGEAMKYCCDCGAEV